MNGFFTKQETQSKTRPEGKVLSCVACGLYKNCTSPRINPYGLFRKKIMIIGEAPGEVEDTKSKPWQGKTGRFLQATLRSMGIDLFKDCISINAIRCRLVNRDKNNRPPTGIEISNCRRFVLQNMEQYQPDIIIPLGSSAIESLIGHRWFQGQVGKITQWRGWTIPDQHYKAWICPTFHPSFVEHGDKEILTIWKQDLQQAFSMKERKFEHWKEPQIKIIEDLSILRTLPNLISIDYETTGLKPHAPGHRIICASVAYDYDSAYVFMMPKTKKERQPFIDILEDSTIGKMAHNMKFEQHWSTARLRQSVMNWKWDSMIAAHILDNRPGICGLKFQTYVNFGVIDYSSEVSPYLKSASKDGNALNRIQEFVKTGRGRELLLTYCAMDTITQYRLAMKQIKELNYDFLPF